MTTNSIPVSTGVSHPVSRPLHPLSLADQATRTASVLLPLIPAEWLRGPIVQVAEAGDGIITVIANDGGYEVTAWRGRRVCDIESDLAEADYAPLIEYTVSVLIQDEDGIQAAIGEVAASLGGGTVTEVGVSVCPFRHRANSIGHVCVGLSPDGVAALGRGLATVDEVQRQREQTIREQVDAAYAEHDDEPWAEYRDWIGERGMNAADKATDAVMYDAIEGALWQDLADALNRLSEWGVDPLLALADQLGVNGIRELDPLERDHKLRYQPPFQPDPEKPGHDLPSGWQVVRRDEGGETA